MPCWRHSCRRRATITMPRISRSVELKRFQLATWRLSSQWLTKAANYHMIAADRSTRLLSSKSQRSRFGNDLLPLHGLLAAGRLSIPSELSEAEGKRSLPRLQRLRILRPGSKVEPYLRRQKQRCVRPARIPPRLSAPRGHEPNREAAPCHARRALHQAPPVSGSIFRETVPSRLPTCTTP